MGKVGAALADEEDNVVFEFVGEGDFAELQRTNPAGDFFGAQGGEDLVELFDFCIAVLIGIGRVLRLRNIRCRDSRRRADCLFRRWRAVRNNLRRHFREFPAFCRDGRNESRVATTIVG